MLFFILLLIFSAIILFLLSATPLAAIIMNRIQGKKAEVAERKLDTMFIQINKKKLILLYTFSPLGLGIAVFFFSKSLLFSLVAAGVGFMLPALVLKQLELKRKAKMQAQLVDGIMLLSSSLKGGLSLLQALEVLVEEMLPPISQEFGLILRENKMGINLDESLKKLHERMHIEELAFLVNSLLVARETGGDLTKVLSRLATTIRDNYKLKEKVRTLTLQGRMQGVIMSVLPFIFLSWVLAFNRNHFDVMLQSETGRMLLIVAVGLQIVGMVLIHRFSIIKI
jgi:tight adherence protein B